MNNFKKVSVILLLGILTFIFCGGNKHKIDVKKDFEYFYSVIEKSFLMAVEGVRKKRINKALDNIEKYVKQEEQEIKMVGVRLNSIILTEKESMHIIKYNEKYAVLTAKYISYLESNFNNKQKDRFVTVVVEGVAKQMMDQLMVPRNTTDFFKKAIR